ncbi:MAG: DUF2163 domain-containing protein [Pseudomonadota bacterium]
MIADALADHLATCATTVCRCWAVERRDGVVLGFTDHDLPLNFDGIDFIASSGMTARAIEQTTGLAVDNTEAVGVLSDDAIREEDIRAGLFDGASVRIWLVNWANTTVRRLIFRGALGEMEREGAQFRVELRGLAEALNTPNGRVFKAAHTESDYGVDPGDTSFYPEVDIVSISGGVEFLLPELPGFDPAWFQRGTLRVLTGAATGAVGYIKRDRETTAGRLIETWEYLSASVAPNDRVRLEPAREQIAAAFKDRFNDWTDYRGFPDLPGEDWLMSYPSNSVPKDGGSRR